MRTLYMKRDAPWLRTGRYRATPAVRDLDAELAAWTAVIAAFDPNEPRDPHSGKWIGHDTPVPSDIGDILSTWVTQGGHTKVSSEDRTALSRAVWKHGEPVPSGLVRGVAFSGSPDEATAHYKSGRYTSMMPGSFSTDEEAALPYAESGLGTPVLLHMDKNGKTVKGLDVSDRASAAGFNESEWLTSGTFVTKGRISVDGEGIVHVTVVPAWETAEPAVNRLGERA
jgi:hypothetical protein